MTHDLYIADSYGTTPTDQRKVNTCGKSQSSYDRVPLNERKLMGIKDTANYLGVGTSTVREWIVDGILQPVVLPGAALREKGGRIVAKPHQRRMNKILLDRNDLDKFIEQCKEASAA